MRILLGLAPLLLAIGCGGNAEPALAPAVTQGHPEATPAAPYDLHEWGLVSLGPNGFELAAGPGRQPEAIEMMTVDKPVLYVHADEEMDVRVTVGLGEGMRIAEHWPPVAGNVLSWDVAVAPGACTEPRAYPTSCESEDGYCETAELALYETPDAACLTHSGHEFPLLFYRMRADAAPRMPLEVRREGSDIVVSNVGAARSVGGVWRVHWDGQTGATNAVRVDVPRVGEQVMIPTPTTGGVSTARAAMRRDLAAHGLTAPEGEAFMRAWDSALFGAAGSVDKDDGDAADSPALPGADDRRQAVDELTMDGIPAIVGGPRIADAILYWLPRSAVEGLATLDASPAPAHVRRAILVRADAR